MEATPLSGLPMVLSGLSALDELCMEKARQLAILAVVAVWKVPLGTEQCVASPDARNMVFGILESGLSVAGSLVGIFVCVAGVAEYLRKKSLYIAPWCLRKRSRRRRRRISRVPHVRLRERRSWRRVDLSMPELRELRELRRTVLISGSGLEGHTVSGLEGHTVSDSALEGHTVSALEGHTVSAFHYWKVAQVP